MADYIFFRKSRNALSSALHILLNIALGFGSIYFTALTGSWTIGILLVLLSKWRVFAVRFRYLFLNIKSNLVDFIVGISFVTLASFASAEVSWLHLLLAILYSIWLIFIKPLSSEPGNLFQAALATFFGSTAMVLSTSTLDSAIFVLLAFVIGYGASRHILIQNDSRDVAISSLALGLLFAEVSWLCHSWVITYTFHILDFTLIIPQLAIILSILVFMFYKLNIMFIKHDNKFSWRDCSSVIIFGIVTIAILVIGFSTPAFNLY